MTYHRPRYAQHPIRSLSSLGASPDGLGAYFATTYTSPISPAGGGASTVAHYQAIQGLGGCAPCMLAALGADVAPPPASPAALPAWLTGRNVLIGAAAVAAAWFLLRPAMKKNGRHRRNAKWSRSYKNSLPDSAFLLVDPGGSAMIEHGHKVTIPRSLRKFPYRNRDGSVNLAHLRNAIARIPQSNLPQSLKTALQAKARSILAEHGGYRRARRGAGGVLKQAA